MTRLTRTTLTAARVLLDDLRLARDKADTDEGARAITRWFAAEDAFEPHRPLFFKGLAAALEQIAKENE